MKKYVIIKRFINIDSTHIYEFVNTEEDAFAMRDILQRSETNKNIEYSVYGLVG